MRNVYGLPIQRRRRASTLGVVGIAAVALLFVSMALTAFETRTVERGGHFGAFDGPSELALATIAMVAIYGLARLLVFEPRAERSRETRR